MDSRAELLISPSLCGANTSSFCAAFGVLLLVSRLSYLRATSQDVNSTALPRRFAPGRPARESRPRVVIALLTAALCCALCATVSSATQRVASGTYIGDESSNRLISDPGFKPSFVLVKSTQSEYPVIRIDSMPDGMSKRLGGSDSLDDRMIRALVGQGFRVGDRDEVNQQGVQFYWVAVQTEESTSQYGQYTGTGSDQSITGLGFSPDYVAVFPEEGRESTMKHAWMAGSISYRFGQGGNLWSSIQDLESDGFEVGDDDRVNKSGEAYYYLALAEVADEVQLSGYWGSGSPRTVGQSLDPDFVLIRSSGAYDGVFRGHSQLGDVSFPFDDENAPMGDRITSLGEGGFGVGTKNEVNRNFYYYYSIAFAENFSEPEADLAVGVAVDPAVLPENTTTIVDVSVSNLGPDDTSAELAVFYPPELDYVSHSATNGSFDSGTGAWSLGEVPADGGTQALSLTLQALSGSAGTTANLGARVTSGGLPDPDGSNDADSVAVTIVLPPEADLEVTTNFNLAQVDEGEPFKLYVNVENQGPDDATGVRVEDIFPEELTLNSQEPERGSYDGTSWEVGNVDAGERLSLVLNVAPVAGTAGSTISNTASVSTSDLPDPNPDNDSGTAEVTVLGADLAIAQVATPGSVEPGDTVAIEVKVTNAGPDAAEGIEVDLTSPADFDLLSAIPQLGTYADGVWTIAGLPATSSATLDMSYQVSTDAEDGDREHGAEVSAVTTADPNPGQESSSVTVAVQEVNLVLSKSVDNASPNPDDLIQYVVEFQNGSNQSFSSFSIEDQLPNEVTYSSHTIERTTLTDGSSSSYDPGTGIWLTNGLEPGETIQLYLNAKVNAGTAGVSFLNTATALDIDNDGGSTEFLQASAEVTVRSCDLTTSVFVEPQSIAVGESISFTTTVSNQGPDSASGVTVKVTTPRDFDLLSVDAAQGSFDPLTNRWILGDLAVGENTTLNLVLEAKAAAAGEDFSMTATTTAGVPPDVAGENNSSSDGVHVLGADIAVTKTASESIVAPGNPVEFEIVVTNEGPDVSQDIRIRDLLPAGLDYQSHDVTTGSYSPTSGNWDIASLAADDSETLTIVAEVISTETVTNQARRTNSTPADPDSRNDTASAEVGTVSADLSVNVAAVPAQIYEGGAATLTVVVENEGPSEATGVAIQEYFPDRLDLLEVSPSKGTYDGGSDVWSVGSLDVGESETLTLFVNAPLGSAGSWSHEAVALPFDQVDPETGNDSENVSGSVLVDVDLSVGVAAAPSLIKEGEETQVTVSLQNVGESPGTGIVLDLDWESALSWSSHSASEGTFDPLTGVWAVTQLDPDELATLTVTMAAGAGSAGESPSIEAALTSLVQDDGNSANDAAATSVAIADALTLTAGQTATTILPGADPTEMIRISFSNPSAFDETLERLTFDVATTGPGKSGELDSSWQEAELRLGETTIASANVEDGLLSFEDVGLSIPSDGERVLGVWSGATTAARDSDLLDLSLPDETAVEMASGAVPEAAWPLDPTGAFLVDGFSPSQLTIRSPATLPLEIDGEEILVFDFDAPANGYEADVLQSIRLTAEGDFDPAGLATFEVYRGAPGVLLQGGELPAEGDVLLGSPEFSDGAWVLSGLSETVTAPGIRIYGLMSVGADAVEGSTLSFQLAGDGLGLQYESDNDGPIGEAVVLSGTYTVVPDATPTATVTGMDLTLAPFLPGGEERTVLRFNVSYPGPDTLLLSEVEVRSLVEGDGSSAELDASWGMLDIFVSEPGETPTSGARPAGEEGLGSSSGALASSRTVENGVARFTDLGIEVPPGSSVDVSVLASASALAKDADRLQLYIENSEALVFGSEIVVNGDWPLASSEPVPVDGMSSAQIEVSSLSGVLVPAGTSGVNVLGFVVPSNGYAADVLESLTLLNVGDATSTDITLELFHGTDSLGEGVAGPEGWTWSGLDFAIPAGGEFFRVQAHVDEDAAAGRTIQLSLPAGPEHGIQVASGNDGPVDRSTGQTEPFEIAPPNGALAVYVQSEIWTDLAPGADPISVLRLTWTNGTVEAETLEGLTFSVTSFGEADNAVVESLWQPFELWQQSEESGASLVATAIAESGALHFGELELDIRPGRALTFAVRAAAQLGARDGDLLDLELEYEDTEWSGEPEMVLLGPTNPPGFAEVDGMSAAQITVHPLEAASVEAGTTRNVVFDFTVPANGYQADELRRVDVLVAGSAATTDLERFEIWSDDGDGEFAATTDTRLGQMLFTGDRWEITGLSVPVPVGGRRLFVTGDIAGAALESRTLELSLPTGSDVGLGMESGNDGPNDVAVSSGTELIISSVDRVALAAREIGAATIHPGDEGVALLHLFATNTYADTKQINELVFDNASIGLGDTSQLDEAFDVLSLFEDDGDGVWEPDADRLLGTNSFESGRARFRNLSWSVPPGETRFLFLAGDVSPDRVRDGDVLFVRLSDPVGVVLDSPTAVTGDWPISSAARLSVDGMVASQIDVGTNSTLTLGPGQGPALAMRLGIPANGYVSDVLDGIVLENGEETTGEIGELRLWVDGGDRVFDAAAIDDTDLGAFVRVGDRWITNGLSAAVPEGGAEFFVSLTVSEQLEETDTVELVVPVGGVTMLSENDGPIDEPVESAQRLTLSSAPLLTSIQTTPGATNVEQLFNVRVEVSNRSGERIENISVPELAVDGDVTLNVLSGPDPSRLDLSPTESGVMTWQVQGPNPGTIRIKAQPQGRSSTDGTTRTSLEASSSPHEIRLAAEGLELFALGSFPVTLSYGQVGVVPLSFTFRNPGIAGSSDIEIRSLRVRLVDESGEDVDPSTVFGRIVVNEGNRIYLSTTEVGTTSEIDLDLATPIAVTTSEPTTISLRVDIAELSPVSSYRVLVESADSFEAVDATSGAPVTIELSDGSFPIVSGLAQLVSEATFVEIVPKAKDALRAAPGATSLPVLEFDVQTQGGSETRIGAFALSIEDEEGVPHPDLASIVRRVVVKTPLQTLSDQVLAAGVDGDSVAVRLTSALTASSGSVVPVTLEIDVQDEAEPAWLRFRLEDSQSVDARDANTGGAITVLYTGDEAPTGELDVESVAESVEVAGQAMFPEQLAIGSRGVEALRVQLRHPGGEDVGRIEIRGLIAQFWNQNRDGVIPGDVVSAMWAQENDEIVGLISPVPRTGTSAGFELSGILLEPGQTRAISLYVDIDAGAAAGWLELTLGSEQISAYDVNSNRPVDVSAEAESELLVFSGLTQLTAPPRELYVEIESAMPAALVRDGGEVVVGDLVFSHPADEGSGPIQVEHITVRFADESGEAPMSAEIKQVSLYRNDELWGRFKVRDEETAKVEGESLFLSEGEEARFEMRVVFEEAGESKQASFGLLADDIGIVQPEGAAFLIEARGKTGSPFPLWTASGSFGSIDLEASYGNFPNPFAAGRESTNFVYYLPESGRVSLKVWTLRGKEVATLVNNREAEAGLHQTVVWDGRNGNGDLVVNGVYLAELEVKMGSRSEKILRKVAVVR